MRILLVTSLFAPDRVGGAEILVEDLARNLAGMGHEVAVAAISREERPVEAKDGFHVYRMGHTTPFFILDWASQPKWKRQYYKLAAQIDRRIVTRLSRVIDDFRPDVINTHSLSELTPLIWPMIGRRGIPLVHTLHDFTSMCTNGSLFHDGHICDGGGLRCKLFSRFHRRAQDAVGAITGVGSDIVERHLAAGFFGHVPAKQRRVIWNPIETPSSPRERPVPAPGTPVVFGYLGRLEPPKGADMLLEALRLLPATGWSLVMAGRAPDGPEAYEALAHGLPVTFPGYMDADAFFAGIDCLVVPPLWPEAFGRTVAEALLRGVPVIGSDLAGVAEQIGRDRPDRLFAPGDRAALAGLMTGIIERRTLLTDDRATHERIAARVHPQAVAAEYANLYRELVAA